MTGFVSEPPTPRVRSILQEQGASWAAERQIALCTDGRAACSGCGVKDVGAFSAIAWLLGITAVLAFVNDRDLRLQADIGLLLTAAALTLVLRVGELLAPIGVIAQLEQLAQCLP